jgi:flagellum-specific ATP synthase
MATYRAAEDMINIGAYAKGSNPKIDRALAVVERAQPFLRQAIGEKSDFKTSLGILKKTLIE